MKNANKFSSSFIRAPTLDSDPDSLALKKRSENINKKYYEESPYRYYIVFSHFLLGAANGFQWVTFSSCYTYFMIAYDLKDWENLLYVMDNLKEEVEIAR